MTQTMTYTKVDIRRVAECFAADLSMLASRTGAMTQEEASDTAYDITLMATHHCLACVHIQLHKNKNLLAAHEYKVHEDTSQLEGGRPGGNDWPRTPEGDLIVIVSYSDTNKAEFLKQNNLLRGDWTSSTYTTNYSKMNNMSNRQYASNGYGWERLSYAAV